MSAIGTLLRVLLIPLGGLVAAGAWADQPASRWTFGTQLGQVRGQPDPAPPTGELSTMSYDVSATFGDKNRVGWRVFTGYRFTDALAIHVGYTDLGKVHSRLSNDTPVDFAGPEPYGLGTQTIHGVDVGLQLKVPVSERIALELRGGKFYWKSRTSIAAPWATEGDRSTQSDSDNFFGAGMEVGVVNDLRATLGWTRYEVAGEPIALWTVGVLYGFSYF